MLDSSKGARGPLRFAGAFTLVELMVVITIVSILSALLLPGIAKATSRTKGTKCVSNLRQFGIAVQSFVDDNGGFPTFQTTLDGKIRTWPWLLENAGFGSSKPSTNFYDKSVWLCPAAKWARPSSEFASASYGYNVIGSQSQGKGTNSFGLFGHATSEPGVFESVRLSEIASPSEMMGIGDSFSGGIEFLREPSASFARYGNGVSRHAGKVTVLYADSHVQAVDMHFVFDEASVAALSKWNRDNLPHFELLSK